MTRRTKERERAANRRKKLNKNEESMSNGILIITHPPPFDAMDNAVLAVPCNDEV